ncbi:DUF6588 family protein [Pedobacter alpinus]|uniref:DUF6588 family protein n=1 Tax=Pedobacter alpinus TaxID=1590643 RepID=A0ABW5TSJ1_9SPHI
MKKIITVTKLTFSILLAASISSNVKAQDVSDLIKSGPGDATKLAQAYLMPAFKGFGFGMNSAWYNSAKAKNLGKFDLRIQGTAAIVPSSDQFFRLGDLGLSSRTSFNSNASTPTLFGEDVTGAEITLKDNNGNNVSSFNMPNGLGFNMVPSPQIQLTVGVIKNTDISVRYSPKLGKSDDYGTLQVLGFGIKHEITKLLMPGKTEKIIPIDIALAFGYNQLTYDKSIPIEDQLDDKNSGSNLNQRVEGKLSGYTFDAIVSKKLAIFTPFASIGYNTAKTELGLLGTYVARTGAPTVTDPNATNDDKFTTFIDPVNIKQKDIAGLRGNVGFSLHLAFFRLYGSYSIGEYQAVTAGLGFGIGK